MFRKLSLGLILGFLFIGTLQGQRTFYEGKIIQNNGDTISALISVPEWKMSPATIRYKINGNESITPAKPGDIKAFLVEGKGTFITQTVEIDQSNDKLTLLSATSNPMWERQTVFLQVLVSGTTNLYRYKVSSFERFFFGDHETNQDQPIKQLVYKKYLSSDRKVLYNRQFRSQLWSNFKCGLNKDDLKNIDYVQSDLTKFFRNYSACQGQTATHFNSTRKEGQLKLFASAGFGLIDGSFSTELIDRASSSFSATSLRVDLEVEYAIGVSDPFAIFANIGFENFSSESQWDQVLYASPSQGRFIRVDQPYNVNASFGTIGFGLRKYIYLSQDFSLSIGTMLVPGLAFISNSEVEVLPISDVINDPVTLELSEDSYLVHRLAFNYKKLVLEARYFSRRELLRDQQRFANRYRSFNISLGVRIK